MRRRGLPLRTIQLPDERGSAWTIGRAGGLMLSGLGGRRMEGLDGAAGKVGPGPREKARQSMESQQQQQQVGR